LADLASLFAIDLPDLLAEPERLPIAISGRPAAPFPSLPRNFSERVIV
jgi:hypothetical protein